MSKGGEDEKVVGRESGREGGRGGGGGGGGREGGQRSKRKTSREYYIRLNDPTPVTQHLTSPQRTARQ